MNNKSLKLPLQNISNISNDSNVSKIPNKRRKINQKIENSSFKTMSSIIQSISSDSKIQLNEIVKLKQDKQNDLNSLNSEIWKIQTEIPEIQLRIEKLSSKIVIIKSNFQSLEFEIENLNFLRAEKIEKLNKDLIIFKDELDSSFNSKIVTLSEKFDQKITNIINDKQLNFKSKEKVLIDKIQLLKNTLDDYSNCANLNEKKLNLKLNCDNEIEVFSNDNKNLIDKINLEVSDLNSEISNFKSKIQNLNIKMTSNIKSNFEDFENKIAELDNNLNLIKNNENDLNKTLKKLNNSKDEECSKLLKLKEQSRKFNTEILKFNLKIKQEEQLRRFLHNKLQEMKGNIRVFCRIKPEINTENIFNYKIQSMLQTSNLKESLTISENLTSSKVKKLLKSYNFTFDKVFDTNSTNGDIFQEISQLVQSSLDGFNVCIFTYGQTGSGKTFTMSNENDGIIPSSMKQIFERVKVFKDCLDKTIILYGQFFEIYGENIRDLIDENFQSQPKPQSQSQTKSTDQYNLISPNSDLNDVKMIKLDSITQIDNLLNHATEKRVTASTMANDVSSRSHSIFKVLITTLDDEDNNNNSPQLKVLGTLNLVDLAGSERLSHSQVTGLRLKETLSINKSLSALGDVIASLKSNSNHIPYRNSKLTYVLKDSLGGDSKTLMFVNISCENSHFNESLSSLRFASKVNNTILK